MYYSFTSEEIEQRLQAAIKSKVADDVEDALSDAFSYGLGPEFTPYLITLMELDWHQRHEDVASALQELRDPKAVEALSKAALVEHEYLSYDDFFGLARKCTWALADIGSSEAKSALEALAGSRNGKIAAYAQKRLDRWADELHRKGT
ncbi:MAG: hypothetical protein DHS20C11_06280 [Lysobacteraceae bacterium]|nr:MAG: hypothetical protein DHS20C11_06280 [Xanthomonadaceae bacterium]